MTSFGNLILKFLLILAISVFMSSLNFMLSRVEHEKCFITWEPGFFVSFRFFCAHIVYGYYDCNRFLCHTELQYRHQFRKVCGQITICDGHS